MAGKPKRRGSRELPRVVLACEVDFTHRGVKHSGLSQDLSRTGIFVRTKRVIPVGEPVDLAISLREDKVLRVQARVAHMIPKEEARALGRWPGIGFTFVERDEALQGFLDRALDKLAQRHSSVSARVFVADRSTRLLERLSTAFGDAGFEPSTFANGAELYSACLDGPPDAILAAVMMPVVDGFKMVRMLQEQHELEAIPVALMSEEASDITRLKAYRLGVRDFIPKPFTVAEVCIRMGRLLPSQSEARESPGLRGQIEEIGMGSLLSLLDFERKSGILTLKRSKQELWLTVRDGRVLRVESPSDEQHSRALLMQALDWKTGAFEFVACHIEAADQLNQGTAQLLLEHARLRDEQQN
jgi:DNA-binding response OmpR family regulator/Tfp pilus assembly protein PilZ